MRSVPQAGRDLIAYWEQDRLAPYLDIAGIPTIGRGATRGLDGKPVTMQTPRITQEDLERLFERDLALICGPIEAVCPAPLNDNQYGALCSFTYNVGIGAFRRSALRQVLIREAYDEAPAQFMRWVNAGGMRSKGLFRRRSAEVELFVA